MTRRKNVKRWLEERKRDHYYQAAKEQGYRSRAAFKLLEVLKKHHIIIKGDKVLDIGAAPGGWTQVAHEAVGDCGLVVAVDVQPVQPFPNKNIKIVNSDIFSKDLVKIITNKSKSRFDVILSDASPNISGAWDVDHYRQIDLSKKIIVLADDLLKPHGTVFMKLFDGPEIKTLLKKCKEKFQSVRLIKPQASKKKSSEIYLLGRRFRISKGSQEHLEVHPS